MQVTIDAKRILHLLVLLLSSFVIAKLLQSKLDWKPLSAWGLGISISCQVSNAILAIMDPESDMNKNTETDEKKWQEERKRELERRKEKRIGGREKKKE